MRSKPEQALDHYPSANSTQDAERDKKTGHIRELIHAYLQCRDTIRYLAKRVASYSPALRFGSLKSVKRSAITRIFSTPRNPTQPPTNVDML